MVTLEVAAKVESEQKDQLEAEVKDHSKEILNTIRIVVAGADPLDIKQDPKLQVIKRDIKTGVENIVSEGLIQEILIPVWQPYSDE
jgi:flagellar basal body-associated protein FliL